MNGCINQPLLLTSVFLRLHSVSPEWVSEQGTVGPLESLIVLVRALCPTVSLEAEPSPRFVLGKPSTFL